MLRGLKIIVKSCRCCKNKTNIFVNGVCIDCYNEFYFTGFKKLSY